MTTFALIPCTKSKAATPCSVRQMYWSSTQFRGAWAVATSRRETILILSAKHGLLQPAQMIEPYDEMLMDKPRAERALWAVKVLQDLAAIMLPGDAVVSYLGSVYARPIVPELRRLGFEVQEPLQGLRTGQRLQWFKRALGA